MPKNKVSDPIVDMLGNNEITNADVYDSLLTLKDTVQIISQIVKENSQDIKDIKRNISFPSKNTSNVHQESQTKSANITQNIVKPYLLPAKAKDIVPIISKNELIGTGQFGRIYKGYYRGQSVALKVFEQRSERMITAFEGVPKKDDSGKMTLRTNINDY